MAKKPKAFDPSDIFDQLISKKLDPSIFETINEGDIEKAPNFLDWVVSPKFLNATILPRQAEMGLKLFAEYCPRCSKPGLIDNLFDQSIGNIREDITMLENGQCPKCKVTRFELILKGELKPYTEFVGALGQRCIPKDSLVFSHKGILPLSHIKIGDKLSHGEVSEVFDSGLRKFSKITTKCGYVVRGATESHIVMVLNKDDEITEKPLSLLQKDDILLLSTPDLWAEKPYQFKPFSYETKQYGSSLIRHNFPLEVTPELARLVGYMISDGQYSRDWNIRIVSSEPEVEEDIKRCSLAVFGKEPTLEDERICDDGSFFRCWSINGKEIVEWFRSIGLASAVRREKFIPEFIMCSPKNIIGEFLAGLYGGDGNFFWDGRALRVQYTTVSKQLMHQLRSILLNLGIVTRCEKLYSPGFSKANIRALESHPENKVSYWMSFKDSNDIEKFKSIVNMASRKKQKALEHSKPKDCSFYYTHNGIKFLSTIKKGKAPKLAKLLELKLRPIPVEKVEHLDAEVEMGDVTVPGLHVFAGDGVLHHNSGKSKYVALVASYVLHRFLKLPNPCRHYNQTQGDMLTGTFSSLTADQAARTLWDPFRGFVDSSPWFESYHKFLKSEGKRLGVELFLDRTQFLSYKLKRIAFHYTGSEDRKIRGATRIFAAPDEIGWMISDETKKDLTIMNADAVYTALSNSLATMRMKYNQIWTADNYDSPPILMCSISSPSAAKDKIMRLLQDAQINEKILAYNLSTWNCNPDYTYETLRAEFSHMPEIDFDRDFGAMPPLASNPFISDLRYLNQNAHGAAMNIGVTTKVHTDGMGYTSKYLEATIVSPDRVVPRMLTFDLGFNKNGLGICLFSLGPEAKPRLDFVFNVQPDKTCPMNLPLTFENFTKVLVANYNIKYAFFDRWQSLDQVQRLRDLGVDAQVYSLKYRDMTGAKGAILSGGIIIPKLNEENNPQIIVDRYLKNDPSLKSEPLSLLFIQALTARDTGYSVVKPLQGDDDILRAFLLGLSRFADKRIMDNFINAPTSAASQGVAVKAIGTLRPYTRGGQRMNGGNISTSVGSFRGKADRRR